MSRKRLIFGLLSARCSGEARKVWNALLKEKEIDGFFDFYPTVSKEDLELRLAEMFHLGRAAYVVAPALKTAILPLLDRVDASVVRGEADTVINEGGVLVGYFLGELPKDEQLAFWISRFSGEGTD